jgi:hypothetical protein
VREVQAPAKDGVGESHSPVRPRSTCCLLVLAVAASAPAARALPAATDEQLNAARATFADAEKDEDDELWSEALAKLRRVAAVKLTSGVRYHIALCEEHTGQLVEALADYTEADRQARSEGARDVLKLVGVRIFDVTSRIPHIALRIVPGVAGLVATVDGAPCADAACVAPVAVDPGPHRVEAHAPERVPSSAVVTLRESETAAVDLVLLLAGPQEPPPAAPAPATRETTPPGRPHAMAVLEGVAAVVLAAGGVGAYVAAGDELTSGIRACRQLVTSAPGACDGERNTVRAWDWTAAAAWVGAAAVGTIAVLTWNGARSESTPAPSTSVVVGPGSAALQGTF